MAALDLWTALDALRDLMETFVPSGFASIGYVRIGRQDMRNEANWRALLVTGNTPRTLWEVFCDGETVVDSSVGGHEVRIDPAFRIEAWRLRTDTTSEAERQASYTLFHDVLKKLNKYQNRRLGTAQAGITQQVWSMSLPQNQAESRAGVLHYRATYKGTLLNQPQESTGF